MFRYASFAILLVIASSCERARNDDAERRSTKTLTAERVEKPKARLLLRKEANPELHNLVQLTDDIYSGNEPKGSAAFQSLRELGVKTIVSVDGATPDVEQAAQQGMRYVHIPIGYDGIPANAGAALARVAREMNRPIYFHCHHGQHRGPAAAAVACIASGATDGPGALRILEAAGTGKNYAGLWRDVKAYRPAAPDSELPPLVEVAEVPSLAAAMAKLDRNFDNLKLCREAEWRKPAEHPDLVAAHEVLMVNEGLQEASRHLSAAQDERFKRWLADAISRAEEIDDALHDGSLEEAEEAFSLLDQQCKNCHAAYRNVQQESRRR